MVYLVRVRLAFTKESLEDRVVYVKPPTAKFQTPGTSRTGDGGIRYLNKMSERVPAGVSPRHAAR